MYIIRNTLILIFALTVNAAFASSCDNSELTLVNNSAYKLRVMNVKSNDNTFMSTGKIEGIYTGQVISPGETIPVNAFSSGGSGGLVEKTIDFASDSNGATSVYFSFEPGGLFGLGECKARVKTVDNGLHTDVKSTNGKPAHAEVTIN